MDEVSPFEPTVVGAVARHWRLVVAVIVAVLIPAGVFAFTRPASYKATAALTVSDPRGPGVLGGAAPVDPDRYVSDQLVVFSSAPFANAAARRGLQHKPPLKETPNWFLAHTSATAVAADNNVVSVKFAAPSDSEAMAGVRAVVAAYSDVVKASVAAQAKAILAQLDASIRSIDAQLAGLSAADPGDASAIQQLSQSRAALNTRRGQVAGEVVAPASGIGQTLLPSHTTTAGKKAALRLLVLAIAFGFLVGVGLAYFRSYRKRVFLNQLDPELLLGAPLLVDVSNLRTVDLLGLAPEAEAPQVEEKVRQSFAIAASLLVDKRIEYDEGGMSFAVVSAHNGASCTAVTWRSALALASQGLRVLLIDVEGSWPAAGAWMARVTDRLAWEEGDDGSVSLGAPRPARRPGPFVARLPVGESSVSTGPQSALYLCSEAPPVRSQKALRALFRDLEDDFDVVMVNAPPFLPSAVAAHLASAAGSAVVVVPAGASVTEHEELARRLRLAAVTAIGYVYCCANCDVPNPQPGYRLRRALHVEPKYTGPMLEEVSGLEGPRLSTGGR